MLSHIELRIKETDFYLTLNYLWGLEDEVKDTHFRA